MEFKTTAGLPNKPINRNAEILAEREAEYNSIAGPRVGDFLRKPDGTYDRFTYEWPNSDKMQAGGSAMHWGYYLGGSYISYSGSLNAGVKISDLLQTDEKKDGLVWFFHDNWATANNGVSYPMAFRVFTLKEDADTSGLW